MKNRKLVIVIGFLMVIVISLTTCIWCPWINEEIAKEIAITQFEKNWENTTDGCYLNCEDCGVIDVKKVFFGQLVTLQYQCGWAGDVITLKSSDVFVNFLGRTDFDYHTETNL